MEKAKRPHQSGGKGKSPYKRRKTNGPNCRLTPEQQAEHERRIEAERVRIEQETISRLL